ncbi:hypothetical protein L596_010749 [Steinernema carpocapsae]|uniref:Uncharacterized protein n=1 Tax=Steinernema carpocapsae TaxID=34508 RepID=A0A4V6A791_STECR|nr:hypothetical protein L596_010749 [Steinernema carpocapsae]
MQFDVVATPKDNEKLSMFFNAWNTVNQVYEQNVKEYIAKTNEVIRVQNDDFEKLNKVVIESFIGFGVLILVAITIGFCFYIKYRS